MARAQRVRGSVMLLAAIITIAPSTHAQAASTSSGQDYPTRPVRFIVGFVPGGISDLLTRALAQKLTDAWGQQVIVDNRAGGGGVISMQIVAKAAPDGYTLLMGSSTQFSINPALRPNLPYDPILRKTNDTLVRALGTAEFREQFNAQGVELMQSTPVAFADYVRGELARWTKVLKEMGINEAP